MFEYLRNRCPRCKKEPMFLFQNPYRLTKMGKMHDACPNCNESFYPEPGFYFGAMYLVYGLIVAEFVLVVIAKFIFQWDMITFMVASMVVLLLLVPINFRLSRILWLKLNTGIQDQKSKD